ncbi:MAG: Crp/Fnr family transcriptional regulator [Chloroflexi bacterium]|nr:Crp/Fnr family transcriptional regulator [Chloroflexota bacterium]
MHRVDTSNRLLASISPADRLRLAPHLEPVSLRLGDVIYEPDAPLRHVYFPGSGLLSVVAAAEDGSEVEVSTIGREGVFGAHLALGDDVVPMRVVCQVPSVCLRLPSRVVVDEIDAGGELIPSMYAYIGVCMVEMAQSVACNRLHTADVRLARWLLTARDRLESDELPLTHEYLAIMLGVHRPRVTVAAGALQAAGLIQYRRGHIRITNGAALEEAACECYGIIRRAYERYEQLRLRGRRDGRSQVVASQSVQGPRPSGA